MKVAVVFDNQFRPETTGVYCVRALSRLVDVEHLLPDELSLIPAGLFDWFLVVDDGLDYDIPGHLRPRAAWVIDTHVDLERSVRRFGDADVLFAAQKNGAQMLRERLSRPVRWLPLACDPDFHRPLSDVVPSYDISFVGHLVGSRRQQLLQTLQSEFPRTLVCRAIFDDMARAYSSAKIGFNCSIADDLNMRLFEVPAHSIPLLTNAIDDNGLSELFDVGKHILVYHSESELIAQARELLNDDPLRRQIAEAGYRHVVRCHTYRHRMELLLRVVTEETGIRNGFRRSSGCKLSRYFEFPRPDVQELVPPDAETVLDIGCGAGRLGHELKQRRTVHVTGVEPNPEAARTAATRLDRVIRRAIEDITDEDLGFRRFDCVILADVLEHCRDPRAVLEQIHGWLTDDGRIVISVPNSRHVSVVRGLAEGHWTYESAGLLDEDHVRCFTRRELEKLAFRSGFDAELMRMVPGDGHAGWSTTRATTLDMGSVRFQAASAEDAEEFFVYQYLVRLKKRRRPRYGLTSIVVVTWNQLHVTQQCIDSVLSRTDEAFELIIVDNGSTDGTPQYLDSIPEARVIRNAENRGFAPAANQGIAAATGDQILLLNNDTIVTTGWLTGLLEALCDRDDTGLVGPVSNNVSGPQQIPVTYSDLAALDGFAWDQRRNRQLITTDRLVGFCLLMKRTVLDRIGALDERFAIGCFEDDDFCRRAIAAGFTCVIARHVFVHHHGSVTFRGAELDFGDIMRKNHERYQQKWQGPHDQQHEHRHPTDSQGKSSPLPRDGLIVPHNSRPAGIAGVAGA